MHLRYTVVWLTTPEARLAHIWNTASDRQAVTEAANRIDLLLGQSPETVGESLYGDWLVTVPPLFVIYKYSEADRLVTVLDVWHR